MGDRIVLDVLVAAEKILRERGWHYRFSSGSNGKLNIRSAISAACSQVVADNGDWYPAYLGAVKVLSGYLKDGLSSWEFGTHQANPRMRTEDEVFDLFRKVISGWEFHENQARRTARSSSTSRAV